jgi:hypothetical protein
MKTACVIQGDLRCNSRLVCRFLSSRFDILILSTWEDERVTEIDLPDNALILLNKRPERAGFSNRNLQRKSTASGIRLARKLGADFVLKWRTDMLPVNLNVPALIEKTRSSSGFNGTRIVTCAYRCLTVHDDWYSTIPDLFSFGTIDDMERLWSDEGFDYHRDYNVPDPLKKAFDLKSSGDIERIWCAEAELYGFYKYRLSDSMQVLLSHERILKDLFFLIDHRTLGLIWFNKLGGFRPIIQGREHPWWTVHIWRGRRPVPAVKRGYHVSWVRSRLMGPWFFILLKFDLLYQKITWTRFKLISQVAS